ncbi:uncharacterized protein [Clytia hemisphaerica]|uniref:uncharacterized protein isoform X2 n=1 Tax=Clytia hemisphaerica TaxID=252671 RepID=UPI0034D3F733
MSFFHQIAPQKPPVMILVQPTDLVGRAPQAIIAHSAPTSIQPRISPPKAVSPIGVNNCSTSKKYSSSTSPSPASATTKRELASSPPAGITNHSAPTPCMVAGGLGSGVFLHFDKKLSDCVKQYPCLYDSKTVGYKDKKTAMKAWELVAKEVEVENGEHAQKLYFNLKKRFHKRRNFLKRLQRSGTNNHILLKKARSDVSVYAFLDWLIPFTQVRQPRVPIKPEEANLLEAKYLASVESEEFLDERPSFVDLHYNNSTSGESFEHEGGLYVKQEAPDDEEAMYLGDEEIITVRPSSPMNSEPTPPSSFGNHGNHKQEDDLQSDENHNVPEKRILMNTSIENAITANNLNHDEFTRKRTRDTSFTDPAPSLTTTHPENLTNSHHRHTQEHINSKRSKFTLENHAADSKYSDLENEDNLFGQMVGAELKGLPYKERCIAKLKIQNILFDMQMTALNKRNGKSDRRESHTI